MNEIDKELKEFSEQKNGSMGTFLLDIFMRDICGLKCDNRKG